MQGPRTRPRKPIKTGQVLFAGELGILWNTCKKPTTQHKLGISKSFPFSNKARQALPNLPISVPSL